MDVVAGTAGESQRREAVGLHRRGEVLAQFMDQRAFGPLVANRGAFVVGRSVRTLRADRRPT
jgi:hypothetical protein